MPIAGIASMLESMLGGRRVTQFSAATAVRYRAGRGRRPRDAERPGAVYVKSTDGHLVQLSNLVEAGKRGAGELSISTGCALSRCRPSFLRRHAGGRVAFLEAQAEKLLPAGYTYTWDGETRQFVEAAATPTCFRPGAAVHVPDPGGAVRVLIPGHHLHRVALALAGGLLVLYCTRFWARR